MRKYIRVNSDSGEEHEMFQTEGVITAVLDKVKTNANGTEYRTFFAKVQMPRGESNVSGSLFVKFAETLTKTPEKGDKFNFESRVEDLKAGINYHWAIAGQGTDEVNADDIADIEAL